jgi:SAM-dependent methyltransferase
MALGVDKVKSAVKFITPACFIRLARGYQTRRWDEKYDGQPPADIFSAIYREGKWGTKSEWAFCSGSGSHCPDLVQPYISAVCNFLSSLPCPPSVVDLGCGDFNIGRQLRPHCGRYIACDVVPELIDHNQKKFGGLQVDFRCLDIVQDDLPVGEVALLRQVLQHLSNPQITRVVRKLYKYRFLVLTEHLPANKEFPANKEQSTGGGVRLSQGSGVVLTKPPFEMREKSEIVLCTMNQTLNQRAGIVKTTLHELEANRGITCL